MGWTWFEWLGWMGVFLVCGVVKVDGLVVVDQRPLHFYRVV